MSTSLEEDVVILHDCLGFRQPAYACFMHFWGPLTSHLAGFHSPIHPVYPAVQRKYGVFRPEARRSVRDRPSVVQSPGARGNLSTGGSGQARRMTVSGASAGMGR